MNKAEKGDQHEPSKVPPSIGNPLVLIASHRTSTYGLSPTVAGVKGKTATNASNIVSPGWKEGARSKS